MRGLLKFLLPALVCALFFPVRASADTAGRLAGLISVPGVAGYETSVREAIEMLLPVGARVLADNLGSIALRNGNGTPHTLVVVPMDESWFVISAMTDDGYLRLHRHTTTPAPRLTNQYYVGQPNVVRTRVGPLAQAEVVRRSSGRGASGSPSDHPQLCM